MRETIFYGLRLRLVLTNNRVTRNIIGNVKKKSRKHEIIHIIFLQYLPKRLTVHRTKLKGHTQHYCIANDTTRPL